MSLSFLSLVKKTGVLPKSVGNKRIDALTLAKRKIVDALKVQASYALLLAEGKPLPKSQAGREAGIWFCKQLDGWWTTVRYGQQAIPISEKGEVAMLVSEKLEEVAAFYDAVAESIERGELDAQILALHQAKSKALTAAHLERKGAA